jgi:hypothetical protein
MKENTILLSNYSDSTQPTNFVFGTAYPGASYHLGNNGMQTVMYQLNTFSGTIKIQGTLALYPSDEDWCDIPNTTVGGDSSVIQASNMIYTFQGNFVWIRAAVMLEQGTVLNIFYQK